MALPTSTIVMALLTAVPFGLAIKDTVTGKSSFEVPPSTDDYSDASRDSYERAQREDEEKQAQVEARRTLELKGLVDALIPMDAKAQLRLPGYELGRPLGSGGRLEEQLLTLAHAAVEPVTNTDGTLKTLTISFPHYGDTDVCLQIGQRITEAWGESSRTYKSGTSRRHFTTPLTKPVQRVTFFDPEGSERCELLLEGYVAPTDFITKTETSTVPVWAVGKPAKKLIDKLGGYAFSDDMQIRWATPGVGEGASTTELYARIVKGKIVTLTATFQASENTIGAVAEKLVADFGEPTESDPVVWTKAKLSLATVDDIAGEYLFVAGEPLPEEE